MKIMFDLYQHLIKVKEKSYYTDSVILLVAKLCHKTIPNFSPCIYHSNPSFYFDYKDNLGGIRLKINSHIHEDNRSGLKDFVDIMNAFREDINHKVDNLLSINEIVRETHGQRILKDSGYVDWINKVGSQKKNLGDYNWLKYDRHMTSKYNRNYINGDPVCEIRHYKPNKNLQAAWRGYGERLKADIDEGDFVRVATDATSVTKIASMRNTEYSRQIIDKVRTSVNFDKLVSLKNKTDDFLKE